MQLSLYYFQTSNSELLCANAGGLKSMETGEKYNHLRNILLFEVTLRPPPVSQKTGKKARTRSLQ